MSESFAVGDRVEKFTGEAHWLGTIVSSYQTTRGKERYVVEVEPQGFQMIAVPSQLRLAPTSGEASAPPPLSEQSPEASELVRLAYLEGLRSGSSVARDGRPGLSYPTTVAAWNMSAAKASLAARSSGTGASEKSVLMKLAGRCSDLAGKVPVAGERDPLWWERQSALRDAADKLVQIATVGHSPTPPTESGAGAMRTILKQIIADWDDGRFSDDLMELHIRDARAALASDATTPTSGEASCPDCQGPLTSPSPGRIGCQRCDQSWEASALPTRDIREAVAEARDLIGNRGGGRAYHIATRWPLAMERLIDLLEGEGCGRV